MSRRELKERKKREKEERRRNSTVMPIFQTGGWYDENEAFTEYDDANGVATVAYTHPAPTAIVSDADKKEQEWNQTQNRMHPTPDTVQRFTSDNLELKKDGQLESKLGFTPYFKSGAIVRRVVTVDCAAYEFINDVYEKEKSMAHSGPIEPHTYDMESEQSKSSLFKTFSSKVSNHINLEAIHGDLEMWHGSKTIDVSRSTAMYMKGMKRMVGHVILKDQSWPTDPIGDYRVYVPDKSNYKAEEKECEKIHIERKEKFLVDFVKISGVNCNYIISLHTGFQPRIHMRFKGKSSSRRVLFRNRYKTLDSAMVHFNNSYKNLVGVRQLNNFECNFINHYCLGQLRSNLVGNEALELLFGSRSEFHKCFDENKGNTIEYPYEADENLVLTEDDSMGVVLSWYPYPSSADAEVVVEDPKDVGFTYWVLFSHGYHMAPSWNKYEPDNRLVEFSLPITERISYDTDAFMFAIKKILDGNNLKYKSVSLIRCTESPLSDERTILKIHQRIGRAAVCTNLWDSFSSSRVPGYDEEWFRYIKSHQHNFPWFVQLGDYVDPLDEDKKKMQKAAEETRANASPGEFPGTGTLPCYLDKSDPRLGRIRKATIVFKDVNYGNTIINYLLPISPRWDTFAFSHKDKLGVVFDPFYRIRRHIPHFVRNVIDDFIKKYDAELRSQSDRENNEWCQFIDVCHAEQIIVEGWPMTRVKEAAEELDKQLRGTILDCSSPDGCGKLLHWPGIAFLNYLQEKHHNSVVMSLNRLDKKIIIIGDARKCEDIKKELQFFTRNRHKYLVKAKIRIEEPRFLPSFGEYLRQLVKNSPSFHLDGKVLLFQGSVYDYERLQEKLDEQQQLVLKYYEESNGLRHIGNDEITLRKGRCPICLNKVSYSNYRLSVCGHLYCMECLCNMISYHIHQKDLPIRCLFLVGKAKSECHEFLAISDILYLLYDENFKNYPLFFKERLEVLVNSSTGWALQNSRGLYRYCSKPGCNGIFSMELMSKKEGGTSRCDVCRTKVCNRCLYPPHGGISCEIEAAVRESSEKSINYFLTASQGKVQRCPGDCGGIIEKDAGCNHMQCRFCKIHFCWLCKFKSYKEPEIYGHMRDIHHGTGGGWDFLDNPGFPPGLPVEENIAFVMGNDEEEQGGFGGDGFPAWVMIDGNRVEITQ